MQNRNVKSLEGTITSARKQLVLIETAQRLLEARDSLTSRREHLATDRRALELSKDPFLGQHVKLSLTVAGIDLELKDLPLYSGDNFQEVLTALAKSCEFAAEAMLSKTAVDSIHREMGKR